jgi:hypothetical protein
LSSALAQIREVVVSRIAMIAIEKPLRETRTNAAPLAFARKNAKANLVVR